MGETLQWLGRVLAVPAAMLYNGGWRWPAVMLGALLIFLSVFTYEDDHDRVQNRLLELWCVAGDRKDRELSWGSLVLNALRSGGVLCDALLPGGEKGLRVLQWLTLVSGSFYLMFLPVLWSGRVLLGTGVLAVRFGICAALVAAIYWRITFSKKRPPVPAAAAFFLLVILSAFPRAFTLISVNSLAAATTVVLLAYLVSGWIVVTLHRTVRDRIDRLQAVDWKATSLSLAATIVALLTPVSGYWIVAGVPSDRLNGDVWFYAVVVWGFAYSAYPILVLGLAPLVALLAGVVARPFWRVAQLQVEALYRHGVIKRRKLLAVAGALLVIKGSMWLGANAIFDTLLRLSEGGLP